MARVVFSASAAADSAALLGDLSTRAGHQIAVKFGIRFTKLYGRLAIHPESGPPRPALGPNIGIGIVSPNIVIYRHIEANDVVTVLRIVHGHRKTEGKLLIR
ncbi:MAG: type II toxin-antitoxin system RelE/ParE family toxin [Beijerinckiaceae bacterium]